jgi:hypothetical protein
MSYTIPRVYIDRFANATEAISAANKKALEKALASIDVTAPNAEDAIVYAMQTVCNGGTKQAAYLARQFYLGLRGIMIGNDDGYEGAEETGYTPSKTETVTRGIVRSNDADAALAALQSRVGYEVKRASGGTMYACGRSDPLEPRFARIPRRSKSYAAGCPFCQMLASRGFEYVSEMSAGKFNPDHYHDGCRCQVVPSWEESPRVEGYNPRDYDAGYDKWLSYDHSQHDKNVRERNERNRMSGHELALARSKATTKGNATKNRQRFSALSNAEQEAYLEAKRKSPGLTVAAWQRGRK